MTSSTFDSVANSISNAKSLSHLRFIWATLAVKLSKAERGNLGCFYHQKKVGLIKRKRVMR